MTKLTDKDKTIAAVVVVFFVMIFIVSIYMLGSLLFMWAWNYLVDSAGWALVMPVNFGTVGALALILLFIRWLTRRKES